MPPSVGLAYTHVAYISLDYSDKCFENFNRFTKLAKQSRRRKKGAGFRASMLAMFFTDSKTIKCSLDAAKRGFTDQLTASLAKLVELLLRKWYYTW